MDCKLEGTCHHDLQVWSNSSLHSCTFVGKFDRVGCIGAVQDFDWDPEVGPMQSTLVGVL